PPASPPPRSGRRPFGNGPEVIPGLSTSWTTAGRAITRVGVNERPSRHEHPDPHGPTGARPPPGGTWGHRRPSGAGGCPLPCAPGVVRVLGRGHPAGFGQRTGPGRYDGGGRSNAPPVSFLPLAGYTHHLSRVGTSGYHPPGCGEERPRRPAGCRDGRPRPDAP